MTTRAPGDVGTEVRETTEESLLPPPKGGAQAFGRDAQEQTDRLLFYPSAKTALPAAELPDPAEVVRDRWLVANGITAEFLDGGIGCCWFAQRGDLEPVIGDTRDEAIARLIREHGLDLRLSWR